MKTQLNVAAYTPAGESLPILIPVVGSAPENLKFAGYAARKGEMLYDLLKSACNEKPIWLFNTPPVAL